MPPGCVPSRTRPCASLCLRLRLRLWLSLSLCLCLSLSWCLEQCPNCQNVVLKKQHLRLRMQQRHVCVRVCVCALALLLVEGLDRSLVPCRHTTQPAMGAA